MVDLKTQHRVQFFMKEKFFSTHVEHFNLLFSNIGLYMLQNVTKRGNDCFLHINLNHVGSECKHKTNICTLFLTQELVKQ